MTCNQFLYKLSNSCTGLSSLRSLHFDGPQRGRERTWFALTPTDLRPSPKFASGPRFQVEPHSVCTTARTELEPLGARYDLTRSGQPG